MRTTAGRSIHRRAGVATAPGYRVACALCGVLLLVGATPVSARQTAARTLGGMVVDAATGSPLAQVTLRVESHGRGATSSADGRFRIEGIPEGAVLLRAARIGYEDAVVLVPEGPADALLLRLVPRPIQIEGFEVEPVTHTALEGIVRDAVSGAGVPRPALSIEGRRIGRSNGDGTFHIERLAVGRHLLLVEGLGYESLYVPLHLTGSAEPLLLALDPDPLLMEGIAVVTERLQNRRRAYAWGPVRTWTEEQLHESPAADVVHLLQMKYSLYIVPCSGGGGDCFLGRGASTFSPTVILDEMALPCGLSTLRSYDLRELHLLEVFDRGRQIRVYTRAYMTKTGRRPGALIPADYPPISSGC
ncbi:carboxypeptidase regulatory-like domain-containing protein [Gemmatimonadota bacterium DH-20]|uniref:Carboxypeptidase regulatory-like domain-containing protein n=1 Tax=Gaopeijia maritima TaxID=3119007 RepID=A0ABU9ECI6_9BACT